MLDVQDRLWISISTVRPGGDHYRNDISDGFIAVHDEKGTRIVTDDLCWANECRLDASSRFLYVNETFGRRLTRFDVGDDGALSGRTTITQFVMGTYPDGLALDVDGQCWVVSVVSNRVIRVDGAGHQTLVVEDQEIERLVALEELYRTNTLTRAVLSDSRGKVLNNISSIAFGGPDLRTAYLGCIGGLSIMAFRTSVSGLALTHWAW